MVVVSLFVNPAQFNDAGDLAAYPRDEERDAALAAEAGADLLFAPALDEVYPPGFATRSTSSGLTETLEGAHRGVEHFDGVTTVVTKLLNMVGPDVAFFGQKDAQQALVIRRLVRDLDLPVRIEVCPTVREPDGLALSSRNVHLAAPTASARSRCAARWRAAEASLAAGERDADVARARPRWPPCAAAASSPSTSRSSAPTTSRPVARVDGEVARRGRRQRGPHPPHRQHHPQRQREHLTHAAHDAQVQDPPRDGDRLRPALRRVDHDRPRPARGRRHPRARAGAVVDVDNGARFETYTIAGERGSGEMKVNGAAARLVHRGDTIIVISYAQYDEAELEHYEPRVVHVETAPTASSTSTRGGDPPQLRRQARSDARCPATSPSRPTPRACR